MFVSFAYVSFYVCPICFNVFVSLLIVCLHFEGCMRGRQMDERTFSCDRPAQSSYFRKKKIVKASDSETIKKPNEFRAKIQERLGP